MKDFDANDWIRQLQAMMADDVSAPFGGSMEKAAAAVHAKVLVIVGLKDHMVNPYPPWTSQGLSLRRPWNSTRIAGI